MRIWIRRNHVGWIHLWARKEDYDAGEPSVHFFNGRIDPLWLECTLDAETLEGLERGDLVPIEDPGYLDSSDEAAGE